MKFKKLFDKTPILNYAAPQWFYFFTFGHNSIMILCFAAFPNLIINIGQWLNLIYGEHASLLERVLKLYLSLQISIGSVSYNNRNILLNEFK